MAVQTNPYQNWEDIKTGSDYRSRETQSSALTRQMLRQPEYLTDRNRVNPGPSRNLRARVANTQSQVPHEVRNEDIWGWQLWTDKDYHLIDSTLSNNLLEETEVGGGDYEQIGQPTYQLPTIVRPPCPADVPQQGAPTTYTHFQVVPSTIWTINHNLGFRPSVELLDAGRQEIEGDIVHPTINMTIITLNPATAGLARFI